MPSSALSMSGTTGQAGHVLLINQINASPIDVFVYISLPTNRYVFL